MHTRGARTNAHACNRMCTHTHTHKHSVHNTHTHTQNKHRHTHTSRHFIYLQSCQVQEFNDRNVYQAPADKDEKEALKR